MGEAIVLAAAIVGASNLAPYTLQLSDVGARDYRPTAAHPVSNADLVKRGTPPAIVRRYGRVGGYERDFDTKDPLQTELLGIVSEVAASRTAAEAHGAFRYGIAHVKSRSPGVAIRPFAFARIGSESRCYTFDLTRKGYRYRTLSCSWRQGRLVVFLSATGFWRRKGFGNTPLAVPFEGLVAKQERRIAAFH